MNTKCELGEICNSADRQDAQKIALDRQRKHQKPMGVSRTVFDTGMEGAQVNIVRYLANIVVAPLVRDDTQRR